MRRKESERLAARSLREAGKSVTEIAKILGVAKSSAYAWTKDIPTPEKFTLQYRAAQRSVLDAALQQARKENRGRARKDRVISGDGYWMIPVPEGYAGRTYIKGLYVFEHRYLMEQHIGRTLDRVEVVHHKNGDKLDNRLANLELISKVKHDEAHVNSRMHWRVQFKCPTCGAVRSKERKQPYLGQRRPRRLIFCSVPCARRFRGLRLSKAAEKQRRKGNVLRAYQATWAEVDKGQ